MNKKIVVLLTMLAGIIFSPAVSHASGSTIEPNIWICNDGEADVLRLYYAIFNREADEDGAIYWRDQYRSGVSLDEVAYWMSQGPEFSSKYQGINTDAQYVERLYKNIFNRPSDIGGKNYWLGEMGSGLQKHLVVRWMAQSSELSQRYPYRLNSTCPKTVATTTQVSATQENTPSTRSSYANCTAVKELLGRPILLSDSGYGTYLDSDRDGVGCESISPKSVTIQENLYIPPSYIYP